jgi:hypothetical protein
MPIIPALGRLRQEDPKASWGYIVRSSVTISMKTKQEKTRRDFTVELKMTNCEIE